MILMQLYLEQQSAENVGYDGDEVLMLFYFEVKQNINLKSSQLPQRTLCFFKKNSITDIN